MIVAYMYLIGSVLYFSGAALFLAGSVFRK